MNTLCLDQRIIDVIDSFKIRNRAVTGSKTTSNPPFPLRRIQAVSQVLQNPSEKGIGPYATHFLEMLRR